MRDWFHHGRLLVGALTLGLCLGGCAGQRDQELRLSEELARSRAEASFQQARVAQLELRLSGLEQRAGSRPEPRTPEQPELLHRLDRLIALSERLLAEPARAAPAAENVAPQAATTQGSSSTATGSLPPAPSEEGQLRALVERLRGRPGRLNGVLTRQQNEALRVLTKPERQLDSENPWAASFY
jgi:hypothetical protein